MSKQYTPFSKQHRMLFLKTMPHLRKRLLETALERALSFSPIVGILGHRQVGKTTLMNQWAKSYFSLDLKNELLQVQDDPRKYLRNKKKTPVGLDECQWAPEIFPALKEAIRISQRPGQFLLSGSVRFTSKKAIRESLTGRVVYLELGPLGLNELEQTPYSGFLSTCLEAIDFSGLQFQKNLVLHEFKKRQLAIETYQTRGGLPGICMIRDSGIRRQKFEDLFETLLERDIQQVFATSLDFRSLLIFCKTLALRQGEPIDWTELSRETKISTPTIKKLVTALESIFLIRTVTLEGGKKGFSAWFEDQGEHHYLAPHLKDPVKKLEHLAAIHLRALLASQMKYSLDFFQYRTRGGACLPICVHSDQGTLGIMVSTTEENMTRSEIAQAKSFLNAYSQSKVISLHTGRAWKKHSNRILSAPITQILY